MSRKLIAAVVLLLTPIGGMAADVMAGKGKYVVCAGCHGPSGAGNDALKYPRLAGLEPAYVVEQLKAFRSGERDNATMKPMASMLSDADMENVAAYIATMR